jgi:hypothetical protein
VLAASGMVTLVLAWQRHRLRQQLSDLPSVNSEALAALSEDVKYAFPAAGAKSTRLTIFTGIALVNGPLIPLMVAPIFIMQEWFSLEPPLPQFAALAFGFIISWLWWSVCVSAWRCWAQSRGMSPDEVQYHGESASILWPRGHFLERTEWHKILGRAPTARQQDDA